MSKVATKKKYNTINNELVSIAPFLAYYAFLKFLKNKEKNSLERILEQMLDLVNIDLGKFDFFKIASRDFFSKNASPNIQFVLSSEESKVVDIRIYENKKIRIDTSRAMSFLEKQKNLFPKITDELIHILNIHVSAYIKLKQDSQKKENTFSDLFKGFKGFSTEGLHYAKIFNFTELTFRNRVINIAKKRKVLIGNRTFSIVDTNLEKELNDFKDSDLHKFIRNLSVDS